MDTRANEMAESISIAKRIEISVLEMYSGADPAWMISWCVQPDKILHRVVQKSVKNMELYNLIIWVLLFY